jgi:hypothetical protein
MYLIIVSLAQDWEVKMDGLVRKGTSPATALASRENGRKSRGPITEQGKATSCANAGKHWGRSEGIRKLMPALGESPAEFDQVRDGLYQALRPSDAFEEMLVDAMVDIHWRLARIVPTLGFVGLPDSPVKFRRILDCLRVLSDLVRYGGFQDEFADYLKKLYGHNPSARAKALMDVYQRGYEERDSGDPDRIAANQVEFQEAIADEIAWFKKRAASHLQARAELRDPTIEAELVSRELDLGKVMLYQDYLERAFERKFKLLVAYRAMRAQGDATAEAGARDAVEVRAGNEGS